jgi:hypothetical protein
VALADLLLVDVEAEASSMPVQSPSTVEVKVRRRRYMSIWGGFLDSALIRGRCGGGFKRAKG